MSHHNLLEIEAVAQRCSVKKVFLEISENAQESTCERVSFLIELLISSCRHWSTVCFYLSEILEKPSHKKNIFK